MICFAWSDEESCADLLARLPELENGKQILDSRYYVIRDPEDGEEYSVVAYDRDSLIPVDYDEAKAAKAFLELIHTIILPCDVMEKKQ